MIRLFTSNLVEALADALADGAGASRGSLFEPIRLVVPNPLVESFVKQRLAARTGIAANVATRGLRGFLRDVVRESSPETRIVDRDAIEGELLALFHGPRLSSLVELEPVRGYLAAAGGDAGGLDRRRVQLAGKLAGLFEEYAFSRPEMLAAWRGGKLSPEAEPGLQRWQRELWLALFGRGGVFGAPAAMTLPDFFASPPADGLRAKPVHVFGVSYVARLYRSIFASLGRATDVHIYALNPCREFWEDLEPRRRTKRDARRFPHRRGGEQLTLGGTLAAGNGRDPSGGQDAGRGDGATPGDGDRPGEADDNPLLVRWGRPGRDNVRLLNQLTDCDFDSRFVDPAAAVEHPSLLATLQQELLDRRPASRERPGADGSLVVLPAADPRRELETVAAEIWALVRRDEERERRGEPGSRLRFSDFAVVVPPASAATYLPLSRTVFHEASELPHTVVDLPSPAEGQILEAVEILLALPSSALARPDLLRLAMHPTVARRFPDVDPEDWLTLTEELQIVNGASFRDHEGSYLEHDRVSWDQGLRRLALGAFLSGADSGEDRPFTLDGEPYLPAELGAGGEAAARALGVLARELLAFVEEARGAPAPVAQWLALVRRAIAATIEPATPEEEAALGDCFAVLERLSASVPAGFEASFLVAADLVRARLREGTGLGHRAPEGVTVASLVPMRALPFRVVFVVGLDERVFPSPETRDTLDLRAGTPREGDVTPRERDEYMFLETLLSARDRLYLSYVARHAITGEERGPSSAISTLHDTLGDELAKAVTRARPALLRHTDPDACAVIPAAARERMASALGASLRRAAGVLQLPPVAELRDALSPESWAAIAPRLGWLALATPGAEAAVQRREPRRSLTLANLRAFLECPLQGSVRVLLPMGLDDDAADEAEAALREHESLEEARVQTVPLLREAFSRALATGGGEDVALADAYETAAVVKQLDGTLPGGVFGRSTRAKHLTLLRCWRDGLRDALEGALPESLAPLWLGGAPEHRRDGTIVPAIPLPVTLPEGATTLALGGVTETLALVGNERIAVTLIASRRRDYVERDLLRPWLTHLALAAAGLSSQPLRALLIRPDDTGLAPQIDDWTVPAISRENATALLSSLAADLLRDVYPYLLPCEGVFTWRRRQAKGQAMTLGQAILMLRDDGWTSLSSKRGPVPDATSYPVPPEAEAEAIVRRRFQPFFDVAPPPPGKPAAGRTE